MFQFPGFASTHYVFMCRYPIGVGCPIRISTDQRLLAAPHGFSQRATSFIASWCQGIHRMPLSRSRSILSRSPQRKTHHVQEPSTPNDAGDKSSMPHSWQLSSLSTVISKPLNVTPSAVGRSLTEAKPVRLHGYRTRPSQPNAAGCFPKSLACTKPRKNTEKARPETYQNLIYTFKRTPFPSPRKASRKRQQRRQIVHTTFKPLRNFSSPVMTGNKRGVLPHTPSSEAPFDARPGGDNRDRTDDPLLAKQVLSQLSYAPSERRPRHPVVFSACGARKTRKRRPLVGQGGFEPPTPRLSSVCSNQLSY
jgi:hypothetical protein